MESCQSSYDVNALVWELKQTTYSTNQQSPTALFPPTSQHRSWVTLRTYLQGTLQAQAHFNLSSLFTGYILWGTHTHTHTITLVSLLSLLGHNWLYPVRNTHIPTHTHTITLVSLVSLLGHNFLLQVFSIWRSLTLSSVHFYTCAENVAALFTSTTF